MEREGFSRALVFDDVSERSARLQPSGFLLLTTGSRIGPYEVTGALGAGGMGEVYRAKDTKLNRDVAVKVLPESFALDADRVARFTREAQVLASLNHPNIAAIYGIEEQGSTRALVMELVEGEDLSEIIAASNRQRLRPPDRASPRAEVRQRVGVGPREQSVLKTPCPSRNKSPTRSKPRTNRASSIAI